MQMKQHAIAPPPCGGFTLVETLVVVALLAVVVLMGDSIVRSVAGAGSGRCPRKGARVDARLCAQRGFASRRSRDRMPDRCGEALPGRRATVRHGPHRLVLRLGGTGGSRRHSYVAARPSLASIGEHCGYADESDVHAARGSVDRHFPQFRHCAACAIESDSGR